MKNTTYFLVFFILVLIGIGAKYITEALFSYYFSDIYWFGVGAVWVTYLWSKEDFTNKPWFPKKEVAQPNIVSEEVDTLIVTAEEREGLMTLFEYCVPNEAIREKLIVMLEDLDEAPSYDEDWGTKMNAMLYTVFFCNEEQVYFIIYLDWKSAVEDFIWYVDNALNSIYSMSIDNLPKKESYPNNGSVSSTSIFKDMDDVLKQSDLQLGFFDIGGDCYQVFIHRVGDKEVVKQALSKTGYTYYEAKEYAKSE
ncbi:MAG: hypothetical protein LBI72_07295 [Flavobacteriaceae bacterium]|jgi:hypothetical protein|nr:hypothetical protein [Flavobacteriaceae bacterium]